MVKPIDQLVNELPTSGMTVSVLHALESLVLGRWQNWVGFENTIKQVAMEEDPALIRQIGERAIYLYNDKSQGYQRAQWLYEMVDSASRAAGTSVLANTASKNISVLGSLANLTPKPEKSQSIDLSIKLAVEIAAFCQIQGIPGDSIDYFVEALRDYHVEALTRMEALVCFDGLVPLGSDFILKTSRTIDQLRSVDLNENPVFRSVSSLIPGTGLDGQLGFIRRSLHGVERWMGNLVSSYCLTPEKVANILQRVIEIPSDKSNYLGVFLDATTNYYRHTGTQTVARCLIERAMGEI
ncbi:MAG: hypothetical protein EA001_10835 [Oscillatoriales cyanobacterium]|nr:MAG: hypothetical protein EA001_10835 [Oscillatoriales cyanobacterium]